MLSKEIASITLYELANHPDKVAKRHAKGILKRLEARQKITKSCFTCGKKYPAGELIETFYPEYFAKCKFCQFKT